MMLKPQLARVPLASLAVLIVATSGAAAQQTSAPPDSTRAQISARLRAFYFNLAHNDWEALTADILAAKVVAHRPTPEALLRPLMAAAKSPQCLPAAAPPIDEAVIALDGDWAEVLVPRCARVVGGADQFRLIHFDRRWRFIHIELFQEPVNVSADH